MRSILMTVLLLVTVIAIYNEVTEGEGGMKAGIRQSGDAIGSRIRQMSP
ncbi:hypothetical protein [Paenibacillus sp. NPDC058071]